MSRLRNVKVVETDPKLLRPRLFRESCWYLPQQELEGRGWCTQLFKQVCKYWCKHGKMCTQNKWTAKKRNIFIFEWFHFQSLQCYLNYLFTYWTLPTNVYSIICEQPFIVFKTLYVFYSSWGRALYVCVIYSVLHGW